MNSSMKPGEQSQSTHGPRRTAGPHRAWSLYVGTYFDVPIYLHFTLILLLAFVAFIQYQRGMSIAGGVLLVVLVFASIALHELGHSVMARRFGIKTDDIVLYPIGGVARLRSMGEGLQELWIAVAGPAVNLVIVGLLAAGFALTGRFEEIQNTLKSEDPQALSQLGVLPLLMFVNAVLLVFNMIPAFPMDGGRVLRSVLTTVTGKETATAIASGIGQALAVGFMILGFFVGNVILMFIGVFVFLAAGQEARATRSAVLVSGRKVREAMITDFQVLQHGDSLAHAVDVLLNTSQQDFPVHGGGEIVGVLTRKALLENLARHDKNHYIAEAVVADYPRVTPDTPLERVLELFNENRDVPVLVFEDDQLIGYIDHDNIMEYIQVAEIEREK